MSNFVIKRIFLLSLAVGSWQSAMAQNAPVKPKTWFGLVSVGYTNTNGNIDRESFRFLYDFKYVKGKNDVIFDGEMIDFKNQGNSIEKMYEFNMMDWYHFTPKAGVYVKATYYENEYRGFSEQWRAGTGLTYAFINQKTKIVSTRVGYQARDTKVTGVRATDYNNGFHHFALIGLMVNLPVVQNVSFRSKADVEVDMRRTANTYIFANAALDLKVNPWLTTVLSYRIEHSGVPVTGRKATDSQLDFSLSFRF